VVQWPAGTRVAVPDYAALAMVWRTGRPAQANEDAWSSASDPAADGLRELASGRWWPARPSSKADCGAR
jgi:hypothetical protein